MSTGLFKSTGEILHELWETYTLPAVKHYKKVPNGWKKNREIIIEDVVMWEQLYYEPGNLGVYVSWSPRTEFYMIVYNLFINAPEGLETFYGEDAYLNVLARCSELGIQLTVNKVFINDPAILVTQKSNF